MLPNELISNDYIIPLIVFFASALEAGFGFGGGLVAVPLLSLSLGLRDSVSLYLVFQFFKCVLLLKGWQHVAYPLVWKIAVTLPIGVFIGYMALVKINPVLLEIGLAAYLFINLLWPYIFKKIGCINLSQGVLQVITGLSSGAFLGLTGTGGPIVVTNLKTLNLTNEQFRFTLVFLFFISNSTRLLFANSSDIFNERMVGLILLCVPAYILALLLGYHIPRFLSEKGFRVTINWLIFFSALALLYKASGAAG